MQMQHKLELNETQIKTGLKLENTNSNNSVNSASSTNSAKSTQVRPRNTKAPDLLKVSSKSSPASVAGAIAGMIKDGVKVEVQSVGAGAVNQAVKAIAISRGFLSPVGIEIVCIPYFSDISINGDARTAIRFKVEPKTPVRISRDNSYSTTSESGVDEVQDCGDVKSTPKTSNDTLNN